MQIKRTACSPLKWRNFNKLFTVKCCARNFDFMCVAEVRSCSSAINTYSKLITFVAINYFSTGRLGVNQNRPSKQYSVRNKEKSYQENNVLEIFTFKNSITVECVYIFIKFM